eukprot:2810494-Lingulodinium_polyedra.AAC.1
MPCGAVPSSQPSSQQQYDISQSTDQGNGPARAGSCPAHGAGGKLKRTGIGGALAASVPSGGRGSARPRSVTPEGSGVD